MTDDVDNVLDENVNVEKIAAPGFETSSHGNVSDNDEDTAAYLFRRRSSNRSALGWKNRSHFKLLARKRRADYVEQMLPLPRNKRERINSTLPSGFLRTR